MQASDPQGEEKPAGPRGGVLELWREGKTDRPSLEARIQFLGWGRDAAAFFMIVIFPAAVGLEWAVQDRVGAIFGACVGYLELIAILAFLGSRLRLRDLQAELRTIDFEEKIRDKGEESPTLLFLKHQAELKRYYDQALQHSGMAFMLGVFCVIVGLAAVGVGFLFIHSDNTAERVLAGALAAIGAVLSGFVARVYLGLHHGVVKSLTGFHEKFVETHHLHVAGVFASRVDDEEKRDETLLALVQAAAASGGNGRSQGP